MKKNVLIIATIVLIEIVSIYNYQAQQISDQPNIIFILADDLGWADLPIYGNRFNEAPNLDKLANQGLQFVNVYAACPVSSPTRASIHSGQYPARVGIINFIPEHWRPSEEVTLPRNRTQFLPKSIITIAHSMQAAGYVTGYFGKLHYMTEPLHYPSNMRYEGANLVQIY